MITQTFTNKTDICQIISGCLLSGGIQRPTIRANAFNQAVSCGKLFLQRGKQAAFFAFCANAVFFTLAYPLVLPFTMVSKGKARFIAAATRWQFSTLALCLPPLTVEKLAAALSPNVKGIHNATSIPNRAQKTREISNQIQKNTSKTKLRQRQKRLSHLAARTSPQHYRHRDAG